MAEIINLRRVRKRLDRERDAVDAAENRARFGRTRAEAANEAAETGRAARTLDGARLDSPGQDRTASPAKNRHTTS